MAANDHLFTGKARDQTYLKARGFDSKSGARSGGIKKPSPAIIPPGVILLRTYQNPAWLFGDWWFTPNEMSQVIEYFGRDGSAFAEGRPQGKGVLQATMAVRHGWGNFSPGHMGLVAVVKTTTVLQAFVGGGDSAPDATQQSNLKPVEITDRNGRRRGVRQIFLPDTGTYQTSFSILESGVPTDANLIRLVRAYDSGPQLFEE